MNINECQSLGERCLTPPNRCSGFNWTGHFYRRVKTVDVVKWVATFVQLVGYALTGLGYAPANIYVFMLGIELWFAVGFLWKDKAIMIVHIGAFLSLMFGFLASQ